MAPTTHSKSLTIASLQIAIDRSSGWRVVDCGVVVVVFLIPIVSRIIGKWSNRNGGGRVIGIPMVLKTSTLGSLNNFPKSAFDSKTTRLYLIVTKINKDNKGAISDRNIYLRLLTLKAVQRSSQMNEGGFSSTRLNAQARFRQGDWNIDLAHGSGFSLSQFTAYNHEA